MSTSTFYTSNDGNMYSRDGSSIWKVNTIPDISGRISIKGIQPENLTVILKQRKSKQKTKTDAAGCYEFKEVASGKKGIIIIRLPKIP